MLGYLNLPPWNATRPPVDGVSLDPAWIARYTNLLDGRRFAPHAFTERRIDDPPHTRPTIAMQLGTSAGAAGSMTGFVASYAQRQRRPRSLSHVMGYYTAPEVPVFDFFRPELHRLRPVVLGPAGENPAEPPDGDGRVLDGRRQRAALPAGSGSRL